MSEHVIKVSRSQVSAARTLVAMRGGPDKVDPLTRKIAEARPAGQSHAQAG